MVNVFYIIVYFLVEDELFSMVVGKEFIDVYK